MSALAGEGQGNLKDRDLFRGPDTPLPPQGLRTVHCLYLHLVSLLGPVGGGEPARGTASWAGVGGVDGEEGGSPSFCLGPAFLTLTPQRGRSPRQEGFFLLTRGSGLCLKA